MAFYNCPGCGDLKMVPDGWPLPEKCEECGTTATVESTPGPGDPDRNAFSEISLKPIEDAMRLETGVLTLGVSEVLRKLAP